MSRFVIVPPDRLEPETLSALLEEYASRDGTDYGERELTLEEKVTRLRALLRDNELSLVYDQSTEALDIVDRQTLTELDV